MEKESVKFVDATEVTSDPENFKKQKDKKLDNLFFISAHKVSSSSYDAVKSYNIPFTPCTEKKKLKFHGPPQMVAFGTTSTRVAVRCRFKMSIQDTSLDLTEL